MLDIRQYGSVSAKNLKLRSDCCQWMRQVEANLNQWLQTSGDWGWQKIRERLSKELASQPGTLRLAIKAKEPTLWKLPWHTWDLLSDYPNVGISYSPVEYEVWENAKHQTQSDRVRLLAIFGDHRNLDLESDRQAIENLKETESVFCHQPRAGDSLCQVSYAFSAELAFRYLYLEGIQPEATSEGYLKLGSTVFQPLEKHTGFYHKIDTRGHQVLLSYRSAQKVAREVTLTEVLQNDFKPQWVKDRLVLIGVVAPSIGDRFSTPFSNEIGQKMPGVVIHAQMTSQMLSIAKQERPLLRFWPQALDAVWIWSWAITGGICVWVFHSLLYRRIAIAFAIVILPSFCFGLFSIGICAPLVPSLLAFAIAWGITNRFSNLSH